MIRVETAVVGGGPAGAATACALASAGREVMVVERSAAPHHKVCGEFLSIETQAQLRRLSVDPAALGAVPVDRVSLYSRTRRVGSALPFRALSLSRYRLDEALLRRAAERGAQVKRNISVRQAERSGGGWTLRCDGGETVACRHLVLATGKWGLRGVGETRDGSMVGLKMHLRLAREQSRALAGQVELALLGRGYAGLEMVEDGIANLCFLVPRAAAAGVGPGWPAWRAWLAAAVPHLAVRLAGSEPLWNKPLAVVCPTGGHLHEEAEPATFRVGDRLAHMPPFTGDGLAIALVSAALAADHIERGASPAAFLAAGRALAAGPLRLAGAIAGLAANRAGRTLMMGAAACAPGLIAAVARRTRMPLAAP